jgi:hypothetical protein
MTHEQDERTQKKKTDTKEKGRAGSQERTMDNPTSFFNEQKKTLPGR